MPRPSCQPCCNPQEAARLITNYRPSVLQILCQQLLTSTHLVCTNLGETVIVRIVFDSNGENPETTVWNLDGTPYAGEFALCCFGCAE